MQQKRGSGPARVLTSAGRGWAGIEIARFTGFDEVSIPPLPKHHAVIYLNRHPLDLTQRLDGHLRKERIHSGGISIIPAGPRWELRFEGETQSDLLPLCLEDAFLREVAQSVEVDPDRVEILPLLGARDPQIERIGFSLKEEAEAQGLVGGKLYAESLANALAIHLIRNHSSLSGKAGRKVADGHSGDLSRRALRDAVDYVGDNLEKDLTLADLAGAARMSPYHFSRLFKASTGLTPHRYVIERRVQRAKKLLSGTVLPIAEIAILCGFANQSHLNRHFKRVFGVSPKTLR